MNDSVPEAEIREDAAVPEVSAPVGSERATGHEVESERDRTYDAGSGPGSGPGSDQEYDQGYDPSAPAPLDVPRTATGDPDVDAALERLGDADHLATDGHVEVYEDVHGGLRDALTALDARPGPPAPGPTYRHRS
ncbi:hypothetical protein [Streptomyces sp. NPDC046197]|uniref:hypothetical protein n=1 Tax=Streptomyces sp. NPDC046197 TaxID=3154337 RepID=UPI0033C9A46E